MKLNRQELLNILSIVKPGLAKKAIVEQSTHFIFTTKEVLTYNDRICICYPFKTDFSCSVPAEEFYKIFNGLKVDDLELELKEGKLKIKANKVNSGLATETGQEILDMVQILDIDTARKNKKKLPDDFIEGIDLCSFSASKDQTNMAITSIFIDGGYIASTDDMRISEYLMKTDMDCSILLPATSAIELMKFKVSSYYIGKDNVWAYFFLDNGLTFCSRIISAEFPKYEEFFDGFDEEEIKLPKELLSMIETASILAEGEVDQDKEVDIEIRDGKLKVLGSNKIGWIESETELALKSNFAIKFTINPVFMAKILAYTQSMYFGENKALFKSGEFRHIIALKLSE